jgi:hypothetical protein
VPIASAPPLVQTLLTKKPKKVVRTAGMRALVVFRFRSNVAGARFECSLAHRVKPRRKGAKARFVGGAKLSRCKSPKAYSLKPGSYRFRARAVSSAGRDSTPVKYNFRVIHLAHK